MAGPTPVSALIHAATMVTAGVYMIARLHWLYELAPAALAVVAVVGTATALLAAVIATAQTDIKKVLAYSTVSQLGLMFLGLGVGASAAAVFHLVTHAFFKALLFLGAGSVIHGLGGEQDMRRMGGLRGPMRITIATMAVGTLAIAGVPPFSGFFSKDEIVWGRCRPAAQPVLGVLGLVVSFLTAYYTAGSLHDVLRDATRG
jgi:NADH-quinone oxidoreductase subunit L